MRIEVSISQKFPRKRLLEKIDFIVLLCYAIIVKSLFIYRR